MDLDFRQNKQKKEKTKYSIINLDLFKPGKKKYPEFDYEEIRRKHLNEGDSSGEDERFHDREALEMVRRLEAKYGNKKTKKGKKVRFGGEDDFIDKAAGYDLEDKFIDDSEAYDELVPSSMDTQNGGFYVNKGLLEFKWRHEELGESDISESEMATASEAKKSKKRPLTETVSNSQQAVEPEQSDSAQSKEVPQKKSKTNTIVRLAGGPPTKRFAGLNQGSPIQKAAQLIKKKRLTNITKTASNLVPAQPILSAPISEENGTKTANNTVSDAPVIPVEQVAQSSAAPQQESTPSKTAASSSPIIGTPARKELPPLTDTLSKMLDNFKKATERLSAPGQKKRLQPSHVDLVIEIEGQCVKDGFSSHEKSRVLQSVADYIGLHRASLILRIQRRKDEVAGKRPCTTIAKAVPENGTVANSVQSNDSDIQVIDMVAAPKPTAPKEKTDNSVPFTQAEVEEVKKMIVQLQSLGVPTSDMTGLTSALNMQQFKDRFTALLLKAAEKSSKLMKTGLVKKVNEPVSSVTVTKAIAPGAGTSKTTASPGPAPKITLSPSKTSVTIPPKNLIASPLTIQKLKNPIVSAIGQTTSQATIPKRVTLGQYMANEKSARVPTFPAIDMKTALQTLETELTTIQSVITSAVASSHTAYKLKVEDCQKSGKQAPTKANFQFTESLHAVLKSMMTRFWQVICSRPANPTNSPLNSATIAAEILETRVWPFFSEMIGLGRLCLEICRRNPENYMILRAPKVKQALETEHLDPSSSTIVGKRGVQRSATIGNVVGHLESDDNDIQLIDVCPSTSGTSTATKIKANGNVSAESNITTPTSNANKPSSSLSVSGIGPVQMAQMQFLLQAIAVNGNDVSKLTQAQQTMLLALQHNMQATPPAAAPAQENRAQIQAQKEQKRLEKELERQKREEVIALKQKQADERKKKIEEEKRMREKQRAEEKAKKQEEERLRKLKEKEEKELQARLELERKQKEERERKEREEDEQRQMLMRKIKQEEEERRVLEEQRLMAMRKEEEFAAILLQEENLIEDGEIPDEIVKEREEELEAEELRIREQREKAEAARAVAAQQVDVKPPTIPIVPIGAMPTEDFRMETKPMPYQITTDSGFASPSPVGLPLRSPSFNGNVAASPLTNSPFAYPASHSSGSNIAPSPLQHQAHSHQLAAIRSPFHQQQHQQSPINGSMQSAMHASPQSIQGHQQQVAGHQQARSSCGMEQNIGMNDNNQHMNAQMMYAQQNTNYQQGQMSNQHFNVQHGTPQTQQQQFMMQNQHRRQENGNTMMQSQMNKMNQTFGQSNMAGQQQIQQQNMQMTVQQRQMQAQQQLMQQQQIMQQMQREQMMYNEQQAMNGQGNAHFNQQHDYQRRYM